MLLPPWAPGGGGETAIVAPAVVIAIAIIVAAIIVIAIIIAISGLPQKRRAAFCRVDAAARSAGNQLFCGDLSRSGRRTKPSSTGVRSPADSLLESERAPGASREQRLGVRWLSPGGGGPRASRGQPLVHEQRDTSACEGGGSRSEMIFSGCLEALHRPLAHHSFGAPLVVRCVFRASLN